MIDFNPSALAPYFTTKGGVVNVSNAPGQLLIRANPSRVLLIISLTTVSIDLVPGTPTPNGAGIILPSNQPPFLIKFAEWGGIVGGEWFGNTTAGSTTIWVQEVEFNPPGES